MPNCSRCGTRVYPMEELKALNGVWHRACFKCSICSAPLNLANYKAYDNMPYCKSHVPTPKATPVKSTVEICRVRQTSKLQSQVKYREDLINLKGKATQVSDDTELLRAKRNTKLYSNLEYNGALEKKAAMEQKRPKSLTLASPKPSSVKHEPSAANSTKLLYDNTNSFTDPKHHTSESAIKSSGSASEALQRSEAGEESISVFPSPVSTFSEIHIYPAKKKSSESLSSSNASAVTCIKSSDHRLNAGCVADRKNDASSSAYSSAETLKGSSENSSMNSMKNNFCTKSVTSRLRKTFEHAAEVAKTVPTSRVSKIVSDIERSNDRMSMNQGNVAKTVAKINAVTLNTLHMPPMPQQGPNFLYPATYSNLEDSASKPVRLSGGSRSSPSFSLESPSRVTVIENSSGHSNGVYYGVSDEPIDSDSDNQQPQGLTTIFAYNKLSENDSSDDQTSFVQVRTTSRRKSTSSGKVSTTVARFESMEKESKSSGSTPENEPADSEMSRFLCRKPSKMNIRMFEAIRDYTALKENEVSFQKGDRILEIDAIDEHWMRGCVKSSGMTGLLPLDHVVDVTTSINLNNFE